MRIAARVEPTRHVINMVEFAEMILREARDRGLSVVRRRYKRRSKGKKKAPSVKGSKKPNKKNPLNEVEE